MLLSYARRVIQRPPRPAFRILSRNLITRPTLQPEFKNYQKYLNFETMWGGSILGCTALGTVIGLGYGVKDALYDKKRGDSRIANFIFKPCAGTCLGLFGGLVVGLMSPILIVPTFVGLVSYGLSSKSQN